VLKATFSALSGFPASIHVKKILSEQAVLGAQHFSNAKCSVHNKKVNLDYMEK
jgi:hypothetical protein